jgi:hypothetical protein
VIAMQAILGVSKNPVYFVGIDLKDKARNTVYLAESERVNFSKQ